MTMPKATIHQNDCTVLWQNNIGCSWQIPTMHPEPKPTSMKLLSDKSLRTSVFPSNARHHSGAFFLVNDISHTRIQTWKKKLDLVS